VPVVTVELWEGRTLEQKRGLVRAITDAMVEHADANPDALHVIIHEIPLENWGRAGLLGVDRPSRDTAPRALGIAHLLLQVNQLDAAERFYFGVLGLTLRERGSFRDGRPLVVANEGLGLTEGRPEGEGPLEHFAFRARGIGALAKRAQAAGVKVIRGPEPSSYGLSLYLADPDGNVVEVFGEGAE
jgi:4-oxalocrotonate tautomerase family enzyme